MDPKLNLYAFGLLLLLLLAGIALQAQSPELSWQECQTAARENYPALKNAEVFRQQLERSEAILKKNWLPQLNFQAQITYQTEVTSVPISFPGVEIPSPNKDQFKATLTLNQLIYDGGRIKAGQQAEAVNTQAQEIQNEVGLYQIRQEVDKVYFGLLLLQSQVKILNTAQENLQAREKELAAAVKHGVALPSVVKTLKVEQLKLDQHIRELDYGRNSLLDLLGQWMGQELDPSTQIRDYDASVQDFPGRRPEFDLFQAKIEQIRVTADGLNGQLRPTVGAFVTAGYGNPGLNFLDNTFQPYAIGGVRLDWSIWDWGKTREQKELLGLRQRLINTEKELFEFRIDMAEGQVEGELEKIAALIELDKEILPLRKEILAAAASQLKNGTLTASQYVLELNALQDAELAMRVHYVQYDQALAQRHFILGSYENE